MTPEQFPFFIGRYKVTGQLGSGGMGVVYRAMDERLHRPVAIKRLVDNPSSGNAHLRIRKEALLLAQLNHNNIVQIYDVVEERGEVALVMEYVDGTSLGHWQREHNPGPRQKIQLLKQICSGLARAHGVGIVHRDLKADNILIDENNNAKITDFGIAKNWRENSDLTREQHVAGSWGAMSPEQALGKPLDNRCDLFALGVLAYRLLCGQNPFGDSDSPFTVVDRIVNCQHPPPAKLNPELPQPLCQLLDKLLAKNPDKRPLNATAVADELDAILQALDDSDADSFTHTLTITAEGFHRQRQRHGRRNRILTGAGLTFGGALLLAAAATLLPRATTEPRGSYIAIVAPGENAFANREIGLLANNMLSAIKQGLSNREGLFLVPYSESQRLRGRPLREQARALNAQLLLHPDLSCDGAHCQASLELIDTENFSVTASRSTMLELDQGLDSRARTLQQLNYLIPQHPPRDPQSRFNISAEDYQRYLELFEQRNHYATIDQTVRALEQLQENSPGFPPYYELFGELVVDQQFNTRDAETTEHLRRFLARTPRDIADHPAVLTAELYLAILDHNPGRAESLLSQLKLTLPDQARYHYLRALYHQHRGEYAQSLEAIDRALAQRTSAAYLQQKALTLTTSGDMEAAKPLLMQAMELGDNNIETVSLLAANELDSGRPAETIRLLTALGVERLGNMDTYNLCLAYYIEQQLEQAQQCFAGVAGRAPEDADPLLYQAEIARALQRPQQARELAGRALALTQGRDDWEGQLMRARAYAELGRAGNAVETLLKIRRRAPDDLYVNYARAQIYLASGDLISAKAHMRRTLELGMSPIWLSTGRFTSACSRADFADLRGDYPQLCAGLEETARNEQIAQER